MLTASSLGFTNGEHLYVDIELFTSYAFGDKSWLRHDKDDETAKQAYRSLIRVSLAKETTEKYEEFDREVRYRSSQQFGDDVFLPNETVSTGMNDP